jgi:hypothetical protein
MSKTLRRPMFRGGSVNSRGTGITSGLDDSGYADGGRVGYKDGPGMYGVQYEPSSDASNQQRKYYDFVKEYGGGEYLEPGATTDIYGNYISGLEEKTKPAGFLEFVGSVINPFKKTYGGVSRFGEQKNLEYATSDVGKQDIMSDIEKKRKQQAQMILANPKLAPDKVDLARQILGVDGVKGEITGLEPQLPPAKTARDEILEEAAIYREALGYDESKPQAFFDALGAAAPAVFQGRNLREAAPKVFEAINKSGAFDKPRDIKQASAQLAVQRKMLKDKAIAEEKTRLALLSAKNQEGIIDKLKIPGSFIAGPLPDGLSKEQLLPLLKAGGIYEANDGTLLYAVPGDKGKVTSLTRI